jgi:hypothetical protein
MAISSGKSYAAGAFALEIEGKLAGFLSSVEGGSAFGDVVEERPGPDGVVHKHLGSVRHDDIVVTSGFLDGAWGDWLKAFLAGQAPQHDGAILFLSYSYVPVRRLEFRHASIVSVTFPRLDGSSKETGHLTVALRPETTTDGAGSGSSVTSGAKTKPWGTSTFVVDLPGIDCSKVSSVAPLTVTQTVAEDAVGADRVPARSLGPLHVGDLVLTVAQSGAADFVSWRDDFLVRGNNSNADEKTATVAIKTANFKDDLFSIALRGVGIHRLDADKQVLGAASISRVTASMYCEEIELVLPKPAAGPVPAASPADRPARAGAVVSGRPLLGADLVRRLEPLEVARRLLATAETTPVLSDADGQRQRGAGLGAAWAERVASLDELSELAAAAKGDWTAIALPDGHSLIEVLQEAEVVPDGHNGDLELARDSFVEGVLAGAADTYEEVRAHVEQPES